jgi:drug/metabolite transporter (DMT)-like permease
MKNQLLALLLLLIMLSGLNTPLTKGMIDVVPPMLNIGLRFLIAFAVMALLRPKLLLRETNRADLGRILLISVFMGGGYILWAVSLLFTTGTNATFFACTSVIFIPFLAKAINKTPYNAKILAGILITVVGMYLLISNGAGFNPNPGDLLALAAAIVFAFQVISPPSMSAGSTPT